MLFRSVLISAPTKSSRSSLSASDARKIFEIYSRDGLFGCLVDFIESPMPSPISAVYHYIEKEAFEPNTKIILVTSTKDAERFTEDKLNKYADKNPTQPSVSSHIFKAMQTGEGTDVSATAMRLAIGSDQPVEQKAELLVSFMPSNLSEENQKDVLNILLPELFMESRGKKQMNQVQEEKILREYVRRILKKKLNEAAIEDTPTKSTGINKLAGVLKIILPQIEASYKNLTTDKAQRDSFKIGRAHV